VVSKKPTLFATSERKIFSVENTRKDALRCFDCDVDVSEEEDNCESLVCGDQLENDVEMDAQRLPGIRSSAVGLGIDELEVSDYPDGEVTHFSVLPAYK
jgi:hypothetical protein